MPKVDFYILSDAGPDAHLRHACRLTEAAVDRGEKIFVRVSDASETKRLDDLLWTFGDRSFLPHEVTSGSLPSHPRIRVLIGSTRPRDFDATLINLDSDLPGDVEGIPHIIEVVPSDPGRKQLARERFKTYRDRGLAPTAHNL